MTAANQTAGVRPPTNTIVGLILIIAFVIAALAFIDSALEKTEQRDLETQAQQAHIQGAQLLKQGKVNQAIELFRKAHVWERGNALYELDLIDALLAARKTEEAEPLVNEILLREPDDGRANLSAARWMLQRGKPADAISYYHRAVYGDWGPNASARRVAVRMELVHLLIAQGRKRELLAELLNLQVDAGTNMPIQKALGHLFLVAGAPSQAAAAYRAMIEHDPNDAEAHAGLGEAELERGEYRNARSAFLAALRYKPQDTLIQRRLELSNTLAELDPTPRRLASMEKYRRSVRILRLAYDDLNACIAKGTGTPSAATAQLLSAGRDALAGKPPSQATNEVSEGVLGLAEKTWQARVAACGSNVSPEEEPLRLIVEKLAQ
jgi:tetratricopeptide (TPR) repeat protein